MKTGGEMVLMRIFIGESDRHGHRPLYEVLALADITAARNLIGFDPKVKVREGLRKTIDAFKAFTK